ncbi:MAG: hypothetical protein IT435_19145 [Phycisphaerales bacterium]|nr:hypothetical protein [Phycisphaerales bacterium]
MHGKDRLKRLVLEALDLPPEQREAYVGAHAADDAERDEALAMLAADSDPHPVLDAGQHTLLSVARTDGPDPGPGSIANYRLLGPISEGGFGVVYLAEQLAPVRRERVAVKVLNRTSDSRSTDAAVSSVTRIRSRFSP